MKPVKKRPTDFLPSSSRSKNALHPKCTAPKTNLLVYDGEVWAWCYWKTWGRSNKQQSPPKPAICQPMCSFGEHIKTIYLTGHPM